MKRQVTKQRVSSNTQRKVHSDSNAERLKLAELNQIAWEIRLTDKDVSKKIALEAKDLATRLNEKAELAQSLMTLAIIDFQNDEVETALAIGEEAYRVIESLSKSLRESLLLRSLNFLAGAHYRLGNYAVALDLYLKKPR